MQSSYCFQAFFCGIIARMIRTYELMVIAKSDFPTGDVKKARELVEKLVKGATIQEVTVLGKKALAYPIKKQSEGVYILATLKGESLRSSQLQEETKLGTDIIRFQLISKEG